MAGLYILLEQVGGAPFDAFVAFGKRVVLSAFEKVMCDFCFADKNQYLYNYDFRYHGMLNLKTDTLTNYCAQQLSPCWILSRGMILR